MEFRLKAECRKFEKFRPKAGLYAFSFGGAARAPEISSPDSSQKTMLLSVIELKRLC